ncbi:MAG: hypothetical protein LE168_04790 [Endomicrobium sp.]|nr:hypothetical protein [Endomicrobium sp.]
MLKNLARLGYKNRYLTSNYYDLVDKYPQTDSQEKRPFTDEEIQKILDNTTFPQLVAHILSIWRGLAAEICYLERSDFARYKNPKIERDYLKVRSKLKFGCQPKTKGSERDVPIHPDYRDILHKMWQFSFYLLSWDIIRLSPAGD